MLDILIEVRIKNHLGRKKKHIMIMDYNKMLCGKSTEYKIDKAFRSDISCKLCLTRLKSWQKYNGLINQEPI